MLDILTWMWHDPHLQGSRGAKIHPAGPGEPQLRIDMVIQNRRRLQRLAKLGKLPPEPVFKPKPISVQPVGQQSPRFFKPEHVVRLAELFKKHLTVPHRFVCICDEVPTESNGVTWIQTPAAALQIADIRSPEGLRFPSCYRRLWAQSKEAAALLSERALMLDIDAIPVRCIDPIVGSTAPFLGWRPYRDWGKQKRIGGGIYLFTPGAHTDVWTEFVNNPQRAVQAARISGFRGSDQAWLSYKLAGKVPVYGRDAGIYSIRDFGTDHSLPGDARLVQMNGPAHCKPWSYRGPASWVAEHWGGG